MESPFKMTRKSDSININKKKILENIFNEYSLKRNKFDPNKPSPNMFTKKLQFRVKQYYNTLSSSPNKY